MEARSRAVEVHEATTCAWSSSPEVTGLLVIGHGYTAFLDFIVDEPVLAPVVRVAAMTGMRRGEVCGLHWADVDLDRAGSRCVSELTTINGKLLFSERAKTDRGKRTIDVDPATVAILRSHRARQSEHRLLVGAGYLDNGLVFALPDGEPLDPESLAEGVRSARRPEAGCRSIRFHDLRHTHVAHLIAAGEQPLLIA